MLSLSTSALPVIKRLASRAADPDRAGIRIAEGQDPDSLSLEVCHGAAAGDAVLLHGGARVFVAPAVSPRLEDLELYAVAKEGRLHLALRERK